MPTAEVHDPGPGRRRRPPRATGTRKRREQPADRRPRRLSEAEVARRADLVPEIAYPEDLPVSARRDEIATAIRDHQVVVVAGETGSGKTTQIPKICLELGRGVRGRIGHTQPRRIAARTVAERIAEELRVEVGGVVGYQMRFTDHTGPDTLVKLMTDGILLAELQHDQLLHAYDTIVIDEAHERSLNIDFLLGYLRQILPRRPDLKVVITSATIDPQRFAAHFPERSGRPAPVVEVSGRTYPVEVRYRPLIDAGELDDEGEPVVRDQTEAVVEACRELLAEPTGSGPGDVLVFLPGEREIRDTADALAAAPWGRPGSGTEPEVVPLYSRLSSAEQHRVFAAHPGRRIVLATNVAETSLTVPGIRYVVDTGVARISRYSLRTKVQRLPIEPVSQASANQRAGRCGRLAPGIAVRLYAEEDYAGRPEFTDPEILRTNLASVILQMSALGLGDVSRFPFLDPPDRRQVTAGVQLLEELGALQTPRSDGPEARSARTSTTPGLTAIGRRLVALPVDPRLARMIVEADRLGVLREVLAITAGLSVQDPRERPVEQRARADQLHARFRHPSSDFLTLLNLWRHVRAQRSERSSSAFRRMCREEHLNYLRLREWQEVEGQLRQVAKQLGLTVGKHGGHGGHRDVGADEKLDEDGIHQAMLAGLLSHIGLRDQDKRDYLGARGARFSVFPGSGLFRGQPAYLMAAELVETSRLYARVNAAIQPAWAERLGAHLVKRSYSEPHWSRKRAAVMASERVTLYGVPLATDRLTDFGKVDPEVSRELFIRHALVYGEWDTRHRFFDRNRALLEEVEELEHRARRRDIIVDEHALFDFYDARVPADVVSGAHFDAWWKRTRQRTPELLTFDPQMLVTESARHVTEVDYPDAWQDGSSAELALPLRYHFEPGADDDGVTVEVPLTTLNQVEDGLLSRQVPGLREDLVVALLRSLPKQLRVSFVPAPDVAREFLAEVPPGDEPLLDALERHLRARTGVVVPREAWDWSKVPAHLRPTYQVVGDDGQVVSTGKDLAALKEPLAGRFAAALDQVADDLAVTGASTWVFGTVDRSFERRSGSAGHTVRGYPAVVDEGRSVGLRVFGSEPEQQAAHGLGVRRLLALTVSSPAARLTDGWDNQQKLALAGSPYPTVRALLDDCVLAAVELLMDQHGGPAWDEAGFARLRSAVAAEVEGTAGAVLDDVVRVLAGWRETDRALTGSVDLTLLPAMADMRGQVDRLVPPGFVAATGAGSEGHLRHLPRYLAGVRQRREKLPGAPARDRQLLDQVTPLEQAYLHRVAALREGHSEPLALRRVRWLLEEYRVSLWAQALGTPHPVSDARIRRALAEADGR